MGLFARVGMLLLGLYEYLTFHAIWGRARFIRNPMENVGSWAGVNTDTNKVNCG